MTKVLITQDKLDTLAEVIGGKSNTNVPLTVDEMITAADSITSGGGSPTLETVTKTYTPSTSAVTDTITPSAGYDGIEEVDVTVSAVPTANYHIGASALPNGYFTENGVLKWRYCGVLGIDPELGENAGYIEEGEYTGSYTVCNAIATGTTVTPTESSQTIGGSNTMMRSAVTVNAIPSNYVGSGITQRTSSDLSASGATVTAPSGYYASSATKTVASGTAGTPTATKGAVNNHAISVTPSVTNTTGYITGGTKTGTGVTVSASEVCSGSETKTANGTYDVTNLASLVVNVSGGSSKNVQVLQSTSRTNSSSLTKVLGDLTVSKTGTYDIYWSGGRTNTSTSYTWGTRLYVDGSGYGTENTTWTNNCQSNHLSNVSLTANQKLSVYARGRTGSYYTFAPMLVIIEA